MDQILEKILLANIKSHILFKNKKIGLDWNFFHTEGVVRVLKGDRDIQNQSVGLVGKTRPVKRAQAWPSWVRIFLHKLDPYG